MTVLRQGWALACAFALVCVASSLGAVPAASGTKPPRVHIGEVETDGGIPVDVIRRVVRQSYGRYRQCYQKGLERRPELQGEVRVYFVIERDGSTSRSKDGGSTLPDDSVIRCIVGAVAGLSFPRPQGPWVTPEGTVNVLVHVWLRPG